MSQIDRPVQSSVQALRVPVAPGVALYAERRDGDPAAVPFVLVHGLASNLRLWDGVAEDLHARGHTVVALDQRGHGRSDAPDAAYGIDLAVADLQAVVEALGLSRPVIAGQSWGGNVVLEYGWRMPRTVRGIVCVDGGIIELADWFDTWEMCLAALTPPDLRYLTRDELESRMRTWSPDLPEPGDRRGARVLPGQRGRPRRAAPGARPPPPDRPLAVGAPAVHALSDARGADAARPREHGGRGPHRAEEAGRGPGAGRGAAAPLALVRARPPRRALAVPGPGGRAPRHPGARRVLRVSAGARSRPSARDGVSP